MSRIAAGNLPLWLATVAQNSTVRDEIFYRLLVKHQDVFLAMVNNDLASAPVISTDVRLDTMALLGKNVAISLSAYRQIRNAIHAGQKVDAIKALRIDSGLGLKEAKDVVESHAFDDYN
jgi:hypothetical protein